MGKIMRPQPVKLFVGIICARIEMLPGVVNELADRFGSVDSHSDVFPFNCTDYYKKQMGSPLWRQFCSFSNLIAPAEIGTIKISTNKIEARLASEQEKVERPMNLDPGYIELAKIVLASTKNFYHRILIADGIYGEVTMHFEEGRWKPFPWTFPDFESGSYDSYFTRLRKIYKSQLIPMMTNM